MGTRNLTKVKIDGKIKFIKYTQWDGYPTGQGAMLAEFIQNELDLRKLKPKIKKVTHINQKELDKRWEEVGALGDSVTFDQSNNFRLQNPLLSRDTGAADILRTIQTGIHTWNTYDFDTNGEKLFINENPDISRVLHFKGKESDSWCEYTYLVDLDTKTVTVKDLYTKKRKTYKFKDFTKSAMEKLEKLWGEE